MQCFNVIFHSLHQLSLVFSDGSPDVRAHKQGVKSGEDAEHLIGILGCSQLVSQSGRDSGLNSVNSLIISMKTKISQIYRMVKNERLFSSVVHKIMLRGDSNKQHSH